LYSEDITAVFDKPGIKHHADDKQPFTSVKVADISAAKNNTKQGRQRL